MTIGILGRAVAVGALAVAASTALAACGNDGPQPSGLAADADAVADSSQPSGPGPDADGVADSAPALDADAGRGAELAVAKGCTGCHGAGRIAPTWKGLYGASVELEDGTTVIADDEYLTRSIIDPGAEKVAGYDVAMPQIELTDDEVAAIVAYIRTLGGGGSADTARGGG